MHAQQLAPKEVTVIDTSTGAFQFPMHLFSAGMVDKKNRG
jgi:hypothetical protein